MARLIDVRDPTSASLDECCEALAVWGFDPAEGESVSHAASWLARLGNNRTFLGDRLIDLLAGRKPIGEAAVAVDGTQAPRILLSPPGRGDFAIVASIWPSPQEAVFRASGARAFGYGIAHDYNFDFLRLGYFGPGLTVDDFKYDHARVEGWRDEPVDLRSLGRTRFDPGRLVHYRANRDVQFQHPPESLSASLTLAHLHPAQGWTDHYWFDLDAGRISRVLGHGPSETFLRIAVALGGEEAKDLASRFGRHHPSDRMRIAAWRALASAAKDEASREEVWREAENSGRRAVAATVRRLRQAGAVKSVHGDFQTNT